MMIDTMKGGEYMPEAFNSAITVVWNQLTNCMEIISDNAILLLVVAVPVVGAGIGLAKRLLRFGGGRGRK